MARTTSEAVQAILADNYDDSIDLTGFIETATAVTDRVRSCALTKRITLSDGELELIERWLAAHFYTQADPLYAEKQTQRARGVLQGSSGMGLQNNRYGQQALALDFSGCLRTMDKGNQTVGMAWLGKPRSDQIDADQRD